MKKILIAISAMLSACVMDSKQEVNFHNWQIQPVEGSIIAVYSLSDGRTDSVKVLSDEVHTIGPVADTTQITFKRYIYKGSPSVNWYMDGKKVNQIDTATETRMRDMVIHGKDGFQ